MTFVCFFFFRVRIVYSSSINKTCQNNCYISLTTKNEYIFYYYHVDKYLNFTFYLLLFFDLLSKWFDFFFFFLLLICSNVYKQEKKKNHLNLIDSLVGNKTKLVYSEIKKILFFFFSSRVIFFFFYCSLWLELSQTPFKKRKNVLQT